MIELLWALGPAILLLVLAFTFLAIYVRLQRGGALPVVRPLSAVEALQTMTERAIEEGRATHVALGTGTLSGERVVETIVGLTVSEHLADQARRANQIPIVTTADPTTQLVASDIVNHDAPAVENARDYARFIAPQPLAYGAGTRGTMQREQLGLTAVVGDVGDEYLYLAATHPNGGTPFYPPELTATTRIETQPLAHIAARNPLIGEETFAFGAYIGNEPSHWASVILQDITRIVLAVLILIGVVAATLSAIGVI